MAAVAIGLLIPRPTIDQPGRSHRPPPAPLAPIVHDAGGAKPVSSDGWALNEAVSGATAATWELARSASEPAARISRQVLDAAIEPELNRSGPDLAADSVSVRSLTLFAPDSATAAAALQQVSDRLGAGVHPLSTTAFHAFGFLLSPGLVKPEVRAKPPRAKGA